MDCNAPLFVALAEELFRRPIGAAPSTVMKRYRSLFGVTPAVTAQAWNLVGAKLPNNAHPRHLLWTLLFLKCYPLEVVMCAMTGANERTVRFWVWLVVRRLAEIDTVS